MSNQIEVLNSALQDRYEAELGAARRARDQAPEEEFNLRSEVRALAALGRVGEIHEVLGRPKG